MGDTNNKLWIEQKLESLINALKVNPLTTLSILIFLILLLPVLLTNPWYSILDFTHTGPIGDTIGGIVGPAVGILSALLVYYSFMEQIKANKLVSDQRDEDRKYDNAKFLFVQLEKRLYGFRPGTTNISDSTGREALHIMAQMLFNDIPAYKNVEDKILRNVILNKIDRNISINELRSIALQVDHYIINIRKSYEKKDDLLSMESLAYFVDIYAYLHVEFLQPIADFILQQSLERNYNLLPNNKLSEITTRIANITNVIREYSSAGQFQNK